MPSVSAGTSRGREPGSPATRQSKSSQLGRWLLVPHVAPAVLDSLERDGDGMALGCRGSQHSTLGCRDSQHSTLGHGEGSQLSLTLHSTAVAMFLHQY